MGRKIKIVRIVDVTELGRRGGQATAANRTGQERKEAATKAIRARWEQYYRENPDKLAAKEARKKKATIKKGRKRK